MKKILFIIISLFFVILSVTYPLTLIGTIIGVYGYYQIRKNDNGEKPGTWPTLVVLAGLVIVMMITVSVKPSLPSHTVSSIKNDHFNKAEKVTQENDFTKERNTAQPFHNKPLLAKEIEKTSSLKRLSAHVVRIIDGDTIKVLMNGREETIRLILVDTPETKHPDLGVQPYGPEASAFTKKRLTGKDIQIEPGIDQRDQFGRLLAYIYLDDEMFNKMLVEEGYARVAVYPPNTKYLDEFKQIEKKAKKSEIGIWQYENYVTEKGYNEPKKTEENEGDNSTPQLTSKKKD